LNWTRSFRDAAVTVQPGGPLPAGTPDEPSTSAGSYLMGFTGFGSSTTAPMPNHPFRGDDRLVRHDPVSARSTAKNAVNTHATRLIILLFMILLSPCYFTG